MLIFINNQKINLYFYKETVMKIIQQIGILFGICRISQVIQA